jgi:hypothetical protein
MTGFCFMFRAADPLPAFDEEFHWWYGDDAWELGVRQARLRRGPRRGRADPPHAERLGRPRLDAPGAAD